MNGIWGQGREQREGRRQIMDKSKRLKSQRIKSKGWVVVISGEVGKFSEEQDLGFKVHFCVGHVKF